MDCKCGDCGYTLPALDGFPKHVFCKHYKLHMSNKADASRCDYFEKKPSTHFDEIKAMSVEELAEFAAGTGRGCAPGKNLVECCFDHKDGLVEADCRKCWLDWLKEEVVSDG